MPSIAFGKILVSDILMVVLLIFVLPNIKKVKKFELTTIYIFLSFLFIYLIETIIHTYYGYNKYTESFFVMDKIAFFYFFIVFLTLILSFYTIGKDKFILFTKWSVIINAVIIPYYFFIKDLGTYMKLSSLFVKPNQFALFIITTPIIILLLDLIQNKKIKNLQLVNIYTFVLYPLVLASASKSALAVLLLTHLIIFAYTFKQLNTILKIIFGLIFIFIILLINPETVKYILTDWVGEYLPQFNRVSRYIYADSIAVNDDFRVSNNIEGLNMFFQNPIIGIGYGMDIFLTSRGHEIHNTYIRLLACLGMFGTILFLFSQLVVLYNFSKLINSYIILFLFLAIFVYGIYHDVFTSRYYFILYSMMLVSYFQANGNDLPQKTVPKSKLGIYCKSGSIRAI
jgi:hypothetical protein